MVSRRLPDRLEPNPLARMRARLGTVPWDLTNTNPTACGIEYPPELLGPLGSAASLRYEPEPRGLRVAREAVAADYRRHRLDVDPERVVLTASTSEAYSFLFKLLCDPGDQVLIPQPSYPLFEHLAALDAVEAAAYPLDQSAGWQPDPAALDFARARACLVVNPNNPTGTSIDPRVGAALASRCARAGCALIADEVFLDYPLGETAPVSLLELAHEAPAFVLGGLSKSVGLPQLKLAWIVVAGPDAAAKAALERLEFISDQYLSVGTPVQLALAELLEAGTAVRSAILARCRRNLAVLRDAIRGLPGLAPIEPAGGWSATLRFPAVVGEEAVALELLERHGVAIYPGYFFGFPGEGYLVVSLLPDPDVFDAGVGRLLHALADRVHGAG